MENLGNQSITFDYKQEGTAQGFNKLIYKLISSGIFKGGEIEISESTLQISPFISLIDDETNELAVRIETDEIITLSTAEGSSKPYVIGKFSWIDSETNFMEFSLVSYAELEESDIIFGKLLYENNILVGVDYCNKSWARIHYEQLQDEPNFKVYADELINNDFVLVGKGKAWINGKYVEFDEVKQSPSISLNVSNAKIDLVVINSDGSISIIEGNDELEPTIPTVTKQCLIVAKITLPRNPQNLNGSMIEYVYNNHFQFYDNFVYTNHEVYENTYIVNSDESLEYWLTNGTSGTSSGGNNFTSVLILRGTWNFDGTAIALDTIGTKTIKGESGSKLKFEGIGAKLFYNTVHKDSTYWIKDLEVAIQGNHIAMENCSNIGNCKISYKGDNIWIACGYGNGLYWSEDGKTWTQSNITSGNFLGGARYANGFWVACTSYGSNSLYWSEDGKTWTQSNITSGNFQGGARYANDIWVACSGSGNGLYWSEDGKTWTQSSQTSGDFEGGARYANGIWIACSYDDKGLYWSTDGKTWTQSNITSGSFIGARYANGLWIACSSNNSPYWSTDGKTWTQSNIIGGYFEGGARYANGLWVACDNSNGLYWSTDGKTWTQSNIRRVDFLGGARYANGIWIACSYENGLYWSEDGKTWTQSTSGDFTGGARYANGIWIASGHSSGLYWSEDGKTWTQSSQTSEYFSGGARTQYSQLINCYNVHNCITTNNTMNTFNDCNGYNSISEDYHGGFNKFLTSN